MIFFRFRSDKNGNYLFSAFSIVMSGDNRYADNLRILASVELYLNSEFYAKHPSFVKVMNSHSGVFSALDYVSSLQKQPLRSSLKIAVPQFLKYQERSLIVLAKSLNLYCNLFVSNKNIFTNRVTLV